MTTERREMPYFGYGGSSNYVTDFVPRLRKEKTKYSPKKQAKYAARQNRRFTAPEEISPRLASIIGYAPQELPHGGMPQNIASCYQNVTTPWQAFIKCEVKDEDLQLALAAMLGSDIWGQALARAADAKNMTIAQFLTVTFELAAKVAATMKTPQDWTGLFQSEKLVNKRRARASKRSRSRSFGAPGGGRIYKLRPRVPEPELE